MNCKRTKERKEWSDRKKRRDEYLKSISYDCCWVCGYKGIAIDIHHIIPKRKNIVIKRIYSESSFRKEVSKCIPLCANCHATYHVLERMANSIERRRRESVCTNKETTRTCSKCNTVKPEKFFNKSNQTYCKMCNSEYVSARHNQLKKDCVEYCGGECLICGNKKIEQLCFHHLDPTQKEFAIGKITTHKKFENSKSELDKCALLCHNCHREIHKIFED